MAADPGRIVVALGGNALAPVGEEGTIAEQFRHTRESLGAIVDLAAQGWRIAIVHGNGPQVGNALTQQEVARAIVPPLPLGVLVAATEGWIGYMVQQSLQNALAAAGLSRQVVTIVTQVLVAPDDPERGRPSKPVGRAMVEAEARALAEEFRWTIAEGKGGWHRIVASPFPLGILEQSMINTLFDEGHLVIAAGGGGTPVYRDLHGAIEGIDAVVDKDRAAAVLGIGLRADLLLILTDVDAVYRGFGTPSAERIPRLTAAEAEELLERGDLGEGSMAPKVEAAIHFVKEGDGRAIITRLDLGGDGVAGRCGTWITA